MKKSNIIDWLNGDDGAHALTDKICVSPPLLPGKREMSPQPASVFHTYDHAVLVHGARGVAEEHQETGTETRTAVQRPHDTHSLPLLSLFGAHSWMCYEAAAGPSANPPSPHSVLF